MLHENVIIQSISKKKTDISFYDLKLIVEPNENAPMQGIFYNLRAKGFPVLDYVSITDSSRFIHSDWLIPTQLIEGKLHPNGWASSDTPNQFLEFNFINSYLTLIAYSLKTPFHSDEIPRNWKVECQDDFSFQLLDNHQNDFSLNPETTSGYNDHSDEKMFLTNKALKCRTIRITQTGVNSRNEYFFEIAAIEFFGEFCSGESCIPLCKTIFEIGYTRLSVLNSLVVLLITEI